MPHYTYKDNAKGAYEHGKWVAPVVFECDAATISEADEAYKAAMKKDPIKTPNIACIIS